MRKIGAILILILLNNCQSKTTKDMNVEVDKFKLSENSIGEAGFFQVSDNYIILSDFHQIQIFSKQSDLLKTISIGDLLENIESKETLRHLLVCSEYKHELYLAFGTLIFKVSKDFKVEWKCSLTNEFIHSIIPGTDNQILAIGDGLYRINRSTGEIINQRIKTGMINFYIDRFGLYSLMGNEGRLQLQSYSLEDFSEGTSIIFGDNTNVLKGNFVISNDGALLLIHDKPRFSNFIVDLAKFELVFSDVLSNYRLIQPVLKATLLISGSREDKTVKAVDIYSHKINWTVSFNERPNYEPVAMGEKVLFETALNELKAVDTKTGADKVLTFNSDFKLRSKWNNSVYYLLNNDEVVRLTASLVESEN